MKNLVIKKCLKCGAMVEVLKDCHCDNCGIMCCGQKMVEVKTNSVECAVEKHLPVCEVVGAYVIVSVPHVMEENHYIECISLVSDKINAKKYFVPGDTPMAVFPYVKGATISSYCNKHGIWSVTL